VLILGLDPGKTTGWALFELEGFSKFGETTRPNGNERKLKPINFGECKDTSCLELVPMFKQADIIVVEDFLVDPNHARRGSFDYDRMIAPQVIGSIKTLCRQEGKEIELQPASIKPVGYGYLGKKYVKGKKGMHKWDAVAHIYYYAVKHLQALPVF
jgi:hypothetical protein